MIKYVLAKMNEYKSQINILKNDIEFYQELLTKSDLSEYEYYKQTVYRGIIQKSMIYSVVEKEVVDKETRNKINHIIVKDLLNNAIAKLKIKERQLKTIKEAINSLNKQDKFIIECKFVERMRYKDIEISYRDKFKYALDRQTIIKRTTKAIQKMEKLIKDINLYFY